jgi:hypothetical protein
MDSGFANTYAVRLVKRRKSDGHFCSTSLCVRATTLAPTTIIMGRYHTPDSRAGPVVILMCERCVPANGGGRLAERREVSARSTVSHCADEEGNGKRGSSRD